MFGYGGIMALFGLKKNKIVEDWSMKKNFYCVLVGTWLLLQDET